jgi:hypothetical protein
MQGEYDPNPGKYLGTSYREDMIAAVATCFCQKAA